MANDREETGSTSNIPDNLEIPVLAIRNTVIFPVLAFPINVGRERSVRRRGGTRDRAQVLGNPRAARPQDRESRVLRCVPDGNRRQDPQDGQGPGNKLNVIIQGLSRARVQNWTNEDELLRAQVETFVEPEATEEAEDLMGELRELAQKIIDLSPQIPRRGELLGPLH